jgi:hypothetical protein
MKQVPNLYGRCLQAAVQMQTRMQTYLCLQHSPPAARTDDPKRGISQGDAHLLSHHWMALSNTPKYTHTKQCLTLTAAMCYQQLSHHQSRVAEQWVPSRASAKAHMQHTAFLTMNLPTSYQDLQLPTDALVNCSVWSTVPALLRSYTACVLDRSGHGATATHTKPET